MEISLGQGQVVSKCAVASENSEHSAIRTMAREAFRALIAVSASGVDLADHPSAEHRRIATGNFADEFVPGNSTESHVTLRQFEIGSANAGHPDFDQAFACSNGG